MKSWLARFWKAMMAIPDGRADNALALTAAIYAYVLGRMGGGVIEHLFLICIVCLMVVRLMARWNSDT